MTQAIKGYEKLPLEFKLAWIKALRSGDYKQGTGRLFCEEQDTYCCLGVACKVVEYNNIEEQDVICHSADTVPEILRGGSSFNPLVGVLTTFNDETRWSFLQIADWIEENL